MGGPVARSYAVTLIANDGVGGSGSTLDVSASLVDVGSWTHDAEKELTKVSPSSQTLKLQDMDGSIYGWIQTQTQVAGALYPVWVMIDVDGARAFSGLAYPREITRDQKTGDVEIVANDWSTSLTSRYLGADDYTKDDDPAYNPWLRAYPRSTKGREASSGRDGWPVAQDVYGMWALWQDPQAQNPAAFDAPLQFVDVGDHVTADLATRFPAAELQSGTLYKVIAVKQVGSGWQVSLDDNFIADLNKGLASAGWPNKVVPIYGAWYCTLTRWETAVNTGTYYVATKSIAKDAKDVHVLDLDTVDQLVPGDTLQQVGADRTITVLQVDPQNLQVIVDEDLTDITAGVTHYIYTEETQRTLVLDDARMAIQRAVALTAKGAVGYTVDFSRYAPPTIENPVLCWLPLRPKDGQDLTPPCVLDVSASGPLRVHGSNSRAWDGSPEAGWTLSNSTANVVWTDQLTAAPSSVMTDETATLAPGLPARDRVASSLVRDTGTYVAGQPCVPARLIVHDYTAMRRYIITTGTKAVAIQPWTGTAWGSSTAATLPVTSAVSACVVPGLPGYLLVMDVTCKVHLVRMSTWTDLGYAQVSTDAVDAVLKTTPTGVYLVGSKGYGRVTATTSAVAVTWITLSAARTIVPSTFCHLDSDELHVLARYDGVDSGGKIVTETHLLRLSGSPSTVEASILATEKIMDGVPLVAGAIHDPSANDRVIGHCGGRLYAYGRTLPASWAIERYTPADMSAMELVEHVCQVLCAVAVPDPTGCLHIISRSHLSAPIALTVDRVEVHDTRAWEHFYSVVRVSGSSDDVISDAMGAAMGGDVLEVSGHPLLATQSSVDAVAQQFAQWFGVPRRYREETWFWVDASSAAPWESLPPLAVVQVNGDTTKWCVVGLQDNKVKGEAQAKLVEVF
jgi:hypothetical protein